MNTCPTFEIADPRPLAAEAPYTFFLPTVREIAALAPGDYVKLIFELVPPGEQWGAERMWVELIEVGVGKMAGTVANDPQEAGSPKKGDYVTFEPHHIIQVDYADTKRAPPLEARHEHWERCMVDACVVDGSEPVEYLYRETPDLDQEGDRFPDSGWRIRGRQGAASDSAMDERDSLYVALGVVLNRDDSWLPLIHAPVGAAFRRNFDTGDYEPVRRG
ncbi:MAG TPA: DUF2185 domain-containing protein [Allosphingosinicella sp.]|jgi:hypothetical protein